MRNIRKKTLKYKGSVSIMHWNTNNYIDMLFFYFNVFSERTNIRVLCEVALQLVTYMNSTVNSAGE